MILLHFNSKHSKSKKKKLFVQVQSFSLFGYIHSFFIWSTCTFYFSNYLPAPASHWLYYLWASFYFTFEALQKLQKVCWKNHLTFILLNRTFVPLALISFSKSEDPTFELYAGTNDNSYSKKQNLTPKRTIGPERFDCVWVCVFCECVFEAVWMNLYICCLINYHC